MQSTRSIMFRAAALALTLLLLCSCNSGGSDADASRDEPSATEATQPTGATGIYELDREAMKAQVQARIDATDDQQALTGLGMTKGAIDEMVMTLTLHDDGTLSGDSSTLGQPFDLSGTWQIDGDAITLEMSANDRPAKTYTGTYVDGRIELDPASENAAYGIVLKRMTQPEA